MNIDEFLAVIVPIISSNIATIIGNITVKKIIQPTQDAQPSTSEF